MSTDTIKVIASINDITEADIKYAYLPQPDKWIRIRKEDDDTFYIDGMICGEHPDIVTEKKNRVKIWKTFNGAVRAIKGWNKQGGWGVSHWK